MTTPAHTARDMIPHLDRAFRAGTQTAFGITRDEWNRMTDAERHERLLAACRVAGEKFATGWK